MDPPVPLFDINKICRVCLEDGQLILIHCDEYAISPLEMMVSCTNVKISPENDELPTSICKNCIYRLGVAYQFKQQCENSDVRLRECLGLDILPDGDLSSNQVPNSKQLKNYISSPIFAKNPGATAAIRNDVMLNSISSQTSFTNKAIRDIGRLDNVTVALAVLPMGTLGPSSDECPEISKEQQSLVDNNTFVVGDNPSSDTDAYLQLTVESPNLRAEPTAKDEDKHRTFDDNKNTHIPKIPPRSRKCSRKKPHPKLSTTTTTTTDDATDDRRLFECDLCNKRFTTSSNRTKHRRIHTDDKDLQCDQCDRSFRSTVELSSHAGTHTGVKSHVCSVCAKAFYKISYLNVHVRTVHRGEKRFRCTKCYKEFSCKSNMTCHVRIHTGERPYDCKLCDAKFNQSSALKRHTKKQHHAIDARSTVCGRKKADTNAPMPDARDSGDPKDDALAMDDELLLATNSAIEQIEFDDLLSNTPVSILNESDLLPSCFELPAV